MTEAERAALVREATERGQAEAATGNVEAALRWLDRACRLSPADRTLTLALAMICLGQDDARAVRLFATITAAHDVRPAWLGLATAQRRLGDAAGAAAALAASLASHVPDPSLAKLADAIANEAGAAGWCGLARDGRATIRLADRAAGSSAACPVLALDGRILQPPAGRADAPRRLPPAWAAARQLSVTAGGVHLLGSPIAIRAITRTEGFVAWRDGGLAGWAWHPGDPDADPQISLATLDGKRRITVVARDTSVIAARGSVLARPRGFVVPAAELAGLPGMLRVSGPDGHDLLGSPLDAGWEQRVAAANARALARRYPSRRATRAAPPSALPAAIPADIVGPRPAIGSDRRRRPVDVVIPVYGGAAATLACLDSVLATVRRPSRVIVIEDASPESDLVTALQALAARRRIKLLRHARNLGFPATANAGLLACDGHDVVLLNSDTLVAPDWLERLRQAAYSAPDIGTVAPLSNSATILSYPEPTGGNAVPDAAATARLAALAWQVNRDAVVDIPVAVGFCMYIRRDCLDATGLLRADLFAQGYGEENDFCLRARHLGWRHVAAPGVFVAHRGGESFRTDAVHLQARNQAVLERLHPGYGALIARHVAADPLFEARRRLDLARWRAARRRGSDAVILITHDAGGGVERQVAAACATLHDAGRRAIVLRPAPGSNGMAVVVGDGIDGGFPNLRFTLPAELDALLRLLKAERPAEIELHHLLGHHPVVLQLIDRLGVPYQVLAHDYAWLCPRVTLVGRDRRYCGEPAIARCEACVSDLGNLLPGEPSVAALRHGSARLLAGARLVVAPTADTAARLRRHFPAIDPVVAPHEDDAAIAEPQRQPRRHNGEPRRICVIGAIGVEKGYEVLLDCARDAAERNLELEFVVVGHTIDDRRLLATGRVFVTGAFQPDEAVPLIRAQRAALALLPSVWPETWCFTLAEAWRAGLRVAAFDIGAQAERIRATGRGILMPLGLSPAAINNALLAAG
jgi:GT2 family glycosyltransferase